YGYRLYGGVKIGSITVGRLEGRTSIPVFQGVNRLLAGDNVCIQQNISIGGYEILDKTTGKLTEPYSAFTNTVNCMYNKTLNVTVLDDNNRLVMNGYNVALDNNLDIREYVTDAIIHMRYAHVT